MLYVTKKPMIARIQNIDVLDLPADALIYSTNVLLNFSGGVGACLVERYGKHVQVDLHIMLSDRNIKFAERGSVFQHVSEGMAYKKVFHTIPSDGFYDTTQEIVASVLRASLSECVDAGNVHTIALSALATGYGHLGFDDFFRIAASVLAEEAFAELGNATICIADEYSFRLASELINNESLALTTA